MQSILGYEVEATPIYLNDKQKTNLKWHKNIDKRQIEVYNQKII